MLKGLTQRLIHFLLSFRPKEKSCKGLIVHALREDLIYPCQDISTPLDDRKDAQFSGR